MRKYCYPYKTHIAILGNHTLDAERAWLMFNDYYCVDCFLTVDKEDTANYLDNIPRYKLENYLQSKRNISTKIIITLRRNEDYKSLVKILENYGLKFSKDFMFFFLMKDYATIDMLFLNSYCKDDEEIKLAIRTLANGRKTFWLNGNCQCITILDYLKANEEFRNQYACLDLPRIQDYLPEYKRVFDIVMEECDLCISQPISKTNVHTETLATETVINQCRPDAQKILISNCTFMGYFPQNVKRRRQENPILNLKKPVFAYGDCYIDDLLSQNLSNKQILDSVSDVNFFNKEFVESFINEQLEVFQQRESDCDIKMFDYVKDFYNKTVLFHSFNHPTNRVIKELTTRILKYIKINNIWFDDEDIIDASFGLKWQMQPIYPSLANAIGLNINYKTQRYYPNKSFNDVSFSFEEYINMYCNNYKRHV